MKYGLVRKLLDGQALSFVDVGCAFGLPAGFDKVASFISFHGFDPFSDGDRLDNRNYDNTKEFTITNKAIWSHSGTKSFYVAKKTACSSLLEPNIEFASRFGMADKLKVEKIIDVELTTIDECCHIYDYLKVDAQGGAYEVLLGARETLVQSLMVEVEAEFYELYKGQKKAGDIIEFMDREGFVFSGFKDLKYLSGGFRRNSTFLGYADLCFYNANILKHLDDKRLKKAIALGVITDSLTLLNILEPIIRDKKVVSSGIGRGIKRYKKYLALKERIGRRAGIPS